MTPLRIPRNLKTHVRSRIQLSRVTAKQKRTFAAKQTTRSGAVLGRNLVGIDGQAYPADGLESIAPGAAVEVVNVGRPGAALYRPATGGSVSGQSAGGGSAGGGTTTTVTGASLLTELTDTNIAADPADGGALIWDEASAKWVDGDAYFPTGDYVDASAGVADAGKPAVIGALGTWDKSLIPAFQNFGIGLHHHFGQIVQDADLPVTVIASGSADCNYGAWVEWFVVAGGEVSANAAYVAPDSNLALSPTGDTLELAIDAAGVVTLDGELTADHSVSLRLHWIA